MRKKIIYLILITLLFILPTYVFAKENAVNDFVGRWAEKISERTVMDIIPGNVNGEYHIFITWRENNLAQKDIYRFYAKKDENGTLTYKNGLHILRIYDTDGTFNDKIDYVDGSGIMKLENNEITWIDNKIPKEETSFVIANKNLKKDTTIRNNKISILLPEELKGLYKSKTKRNGIFIYDKASKDAGFGGYAFGIMAYKKPSEYAMMPGGRKIGEWESAIGSKYDIILSQPTDVQYDYTKGPKIPDSYRMLYSIGEIVNITGTGRNKYFKNRGMKGEDLYNNILQKHITAIKEKWDSTKLEQENMSYMYNVLAETNNNVLDKIGYAYYDVNADGVDELFIGEIANDNWKGIVYDIYTMVNKKPAHVISGGSRNRFFACNDVFLCNEYSSGAGESGWLVYILVENSTELYPQIGFKYDSYENISRPWFISYDFLSDKWINVTESTFKERKSVFDKYRRFEFIPLSKIENN